MFFLVQPERRSEMKPQHLRAFRRRAAAARRELRHIAGRGHGLPCHWLYYSCASPFARVLPLVLMTAECRVLHTYMVPRPAYAYSAFAVLI
jgi:hypothetical protein